MAAERRKLYCCLSTETTLFNLETAQEACKSLRPYF
jgi:hypothetical protein